MLFGAAVQLLLWMMALKVFVVVVKIDFARNEP
jgi:hypothetical protein